MNEFEYGALVEW